MKISPLLVLALSWVPSLLMAQQPAAPPAEIPPLPPGPLIQVRAPEMAQWIVTPAQPAQAAAIPAAKPEENAAKPLLIATTKTGKTMLRQRQEPTGQILSTWCVDGQQITLWPDGKHWIVQIAKVNPNLPDANYVDYSKSDFPEFAWISKGNYAGIQKFKGVDCIVFKAQIRVESDDPAPTSFAAYIDVNTRFPLLLQDGDGIHLYEYKAAPKEPLTLPPQVQSLLGSRQSVVKALTRQLPTGGQ